MLLEIGVPGEPAPIYGGDPFNRCTHTALSPEGDLYVADGYGNARVHKYSPNGKLQFSWGEPGTDPGAFNIVHNICCDEDGWVYVADRENHRVQVFDGKGKYHAQWNNLHRPCGLCMTRGRNPIAYIGESGPGMAVNAKSPGHRASRVHRDARGQADRAARRCDARAGEPVHRASWRGDRLARRHLCRRGVAHGDAQSGHSDRGGGGYPLHAEAGEAGVRSGLRLR